MNEPDWSVEERIPIRKMLTMADLFSLGNGFLGMLAILSTSLGEVRIAYTLILVAAIFDGVDGFLSRMGHGGGRLGGKLDTLADLVSFVAAPTFLFWSTYGPTATLPLAMGPPLLEALAGAGLVLAVAAAFFGAGILRLARFDYLQGGNRHDYFIGITTPCGAGILASLALLQWSLPVVLGITLLTCALMTSRLRLPKLRGAMAPAAALVVLAGAVLGSSNGNLGPILILTASLVYLFLGPGYVRRHLDVDEAPLTF